MLKKREGSDPSPKLTNKKLKDRTFFYLVMQMYGKDLVFPNIKQSLTISSPTSSRGFRPNFDVFFDTCVNESENFQKKVSQIFGFFTFFSYICLVNE